MEHQSTVREESSEGQEPVSVGKAIAPPFSEVFTDYAPFVWRVLRRMGVAEADVEDLCQEVFLVVHRRLAEFQGRSSLRTWIFSICRWVARSHWNRAYQRYESLPEKLPEPALSAEQHSDLVRRETLQRLDRILAQLPEPQRLVYILYEIERLPMAEVAVMAECPIQTAYSRLYAARREIGKAVVRAEAVGRQT